MAVSKRTRFEVLRRDDHTCRYCRSTDNPLTIDHVTPVALGGTDDPSNLVTACRDCNAGKASSAPDAELVANVSDDAIRWAKARIEAARQFESDQQARIERTSPFIDAWRGWDTHLTYLPGDFDWKVNRWLDSGLTIERIIEAHDITLCRPQVKPQGAFAYICGIVRNWTADIDARTARLLVDGEEVGFPTADDILVDFIDRFGRGLEVA